jgi:hypothetical protein
MISQKVIDPEHLPDKTLQYTAKAIGMLPTQYNQNYMLMEKPAYH